MKFNYGKSEYMTDNTDKWESLILIENKCANMATVERYWPGKPPDLICMDHAEQSMNIAQHMGFGLYLKPITYDITKPIPTEFPVCCCKIK